MESLIFFLRLPFMPVPISASTMTAFLETFNFSIELIEIILALDAFISLNALLDTPLISLEGQQVTIVTFRPNSFAKLPKRKPSPEFFPFAQKITNSSSGPNSFKITSNANSAALCISE